MIGYTMKRIFSEKEVYSVDWFFNCIIVRCIDECSGGI